MSTSTNYVAITRNGGTVTWLPVRTDIQQQVQVAMHGGDADTNLIGGGFVLDFSFARNWSVSGGSLSGSTWTVPQTAGLFSVSCTGYDMAWYGPDTDDPDVNLTNSLAMQVVYDIAMKSFLTGAELEANPEALGGGRKIFPGKDNPTDTQAGDRRKVQIEATVSTPMAGVTVYFKFWDVDDPSASTAPLDNDPNEIDNRGSFTWAGVSGDVYSTTTDSTGKATATLLSSYQPGDNCRVTAACYNAGNSLGTWSAVNAGTHPPHGKTTEMLTVWRKLHLEMDSMGAPGSLSEGAHLFDGDSALTGNSTILESNDLYEMGKDWRPIGQLLGGLLDPNTNDSIADKFVITGHTMSTLAVSTNLQQGGSPTLTSNAEDGDPYAISLADPYPGSITVPPLAVFEDAFKECYIVVVQDLSEYESGDVEFQRYLPPNVLLNTLGPAQRGTKNMEGANFWIVYALMSYECTEDDDRDPDQEPRRHGIASKAEPEYAAVYTEVIRDSHAGGQWPSLSLSQANASILTHECAHQFDIEDCTNTCLMKPGDSSLLFCDFCKNQIRTNSP